MSNPLSDLQQLLAGQMSMAGRVISVANGVVRVATANGLVEVPFDGSVGDRVTVRDGRATKSQEAAGAPVFLV